MKKQSIRSLKNATCLTAIALTATATSLSAIERVTPAAEPKEKAAPAPKRVAPIQPQLKIIPIPQVQQENQPFIGVFGKPIDEVIADQLNIKNGVILLFVNPGSPAAKAGLKPNDIITKIDNNPINQQKDVKNSLNGKKPGDKINVELLSKGKKSILQIELGNRADMAQNRLKIQPHPAPKMGKLPEGFLPPEVLENLPPEQRKKIEKLLQGKIDIEGFELKAPQLNQLEKQFKDLNKNRNHLQFKKLLQGQMNMNLLDAEGSIKLKGVDGKKAIELYDTKGKLLYKGPYNNEKDLAKVPKELQDRVKKFDLLKKKPMVPNMRLPMLEGGIFPEGAGIEQLKDLLLKMEGGAIGPNFPQQKGGIQQRFDFQLGANGNQTRSQMIDPRTGNKYTYSKTKDGKEIEVFDKAGKLLFSGPYNNELDKESVPEEYRPFLKSIQGIQLNGNQFKFDLKNK